MAKWAGHRSAAFTKIRYAHFFPEHGEALAERAEIATYAGHRSASFTKDRYAHLFKEAGAKLADRLDALIESARAASVSHPDPARTADHSRDEEEAARSAGGEHGC